MHLSAKGTGALLLAFSAFFASPALAQTAPSQEEVAAYRGLHAAAAKGDAAEIGRLAKGGANLNARDGHGRTPLMVAAYGGHHAAARSLIESGADLNARDQARYDVITIAAVANDLKMLRIAIAAGANTGLITSPYDGTALIAAAHLGHAEIVQALIKGKAPLDHVNNLGWTALIESIVLGDGGPRHVATLRALVEAGANVNLADGRGVRPLTLARQRGYGEMVRILEKAGARP
ncbi:MAG: ankyrin repeat domain-containing protein [bacterium]|nr:ankyrin repeat domain-containing protein [bacterium]